ncbi:alpha-glucosidase [Schaalia sp. 19OD2882]|uniref:alpha-glucosidase n=1 Tax=Schaalia sp. 19OD2882 TaxID=2794089 RepID=UPI001C1EDD3F|nr:alpha-glucosidase [Schaalia sp. 19OD2882]QWW20520.1 alpha-glucosidase [Schaalia sp. 19OD2882]
MSTLSAPGRPWWRTATAYQVYPRSFQDSDGDGIGDIPGITSRIPYLATLGVDVLWLSPVYRSPMEDNGYDISDYEDVDPVFGSLADLERLIETAHEAGIRIVMDLVVNHTSDQHPWFQASRNPADPKRDWYVWRRPRELPEGAPVDTDAAPGQWRGDEPNGWVSAFSGPVWTLDEASGEYYLHFFAPGQPDLNWENPEVRHAVHAMMRRWIDRGVDGFRMDVINCISKPEDLYQDSSGGLDKAFFGPRFHEWMQEMHREVFDRYPDTVFLTVGECPGATIDQARLTTDPVRRELDMVFQFEHVELDATDGDKFRPRPMPLQEMKRSLASWTKGLAGRGWNSLYLSNHDRPRPVSRFGSPEHHRHASATAWGGMLHAHQGTPFVYQGEELGMADYPWTSIDQFDDVETKGVWRERVELGGQDPSIVWPGIVHASRDNARTPVHWDAGEHAGFTTGTPWLPVNPDHTWLNAAAQVGVAGSTFEFYRRMIALRKELPVLVDGSFELLHADDPKLWWVRREFDGVRLDAVGNMSDAPLTCDLPSGEVVLSNACEAGEGGKAPACRMDQLAPWEIRWVLS